MVKGGYELQAARAQQAVAKHIAAHVADAGDGESIALGIFAHLVKVPFDALPRPAGGDRFLLMVVALRATRSESVAEPELTTLGDTVGGIGEMRRAFVGGNHQIMIRFVVA